MSDDESRRRKKRDRKRRRDQGSARRQERRDKAKRGSIQRRVSWPTAGKPVESMTDAELRAIAIHPMPTGLGSHLRTVSDEDWVVSALKQQKTFGCEAFWNDFLDVLRETFDLWFDPTHPLAKTGSYPEPTTDAEVPLPNAALGIGDKGWSAREWTADMVVGIHSNPTYTGLGPFAPLIEQQTWVRIACKETEWPYQMQQLVNVLHALRRTFGTPANPRRLLPFGYDIPPPPHVAG